MTLLRRCVPGLALALLAACATSRTRPASDLETSYADLRDVRDAIDVAEARGLDHADDGRALSDLRRDYAQRRSALAVALDSSSRTGGADETALAAMRQALDSALSAEAQAESGNTTETAD